MPEISVIVPVYNKEKYLERCLDSILNQVFSDFQLITVDDGSTDHSLDILREYAARDSRIMVMHTNNHGVSHARNTGLDNASGRYITFVDADDEILPDYLGSLYTDIRSQGADIVIHGLIKIDSFCNGTSVIPPLQGKYTVDELLESFADVQRKTGIYGYCVGKIFHFDHVKHLRFDENIQLAEDFDFYLRMYSEINTIFFGQSTNYIYHVGIAGSSMDMDDEDIDYYSQLLINIRYREFLISKNAYSGINKSLIDQTINNYIFFTLFNCPDDRFE